jgi:hypothetical protein
MNVHSVAVVLSDASENARLHNVNDCRPSQLPWYQRDGRSVDLSS